MFKKVVLIFIAILIIGSVCFAGVIGIREWQDRIHYDAMVEEGSKECSELKEMLLSQQITIEINEKSLSKSYSDLANVEVLVHFPSLQESKIETYQIKVSRSVNTEELRKEIIALYESPVNAKVRFSKDSGWYIEEEHDDYCFDISGAYSYVYDGLLQGSTDFNLDKFRSKSAIVAEDLVETYSKVSWLNGFEVQYGGITYLTGYDISCFVSNYELDTESIDLSSIRDGLKSVYDTTGSTVTFHTASGDDIDVRYGTLGKSINWDKTRRDILSAIDSHTSLYADYPQLYGYEFNKSEYIEISLKDQHVWHYKDNVLCCESDCVTGTKNRMDTPKGAYYISECIPGKYLVGDDYRVWVDRWMRLTNSGIGLHDASSRRAFGGDIYTYNGSHGCINLPPKYAYSLFDEVSNGTTVVIY